MLAKRLTVVAAIIVVVAVASPGFAQEPKDCQSLAGSLGASLNLSEGGWSGTAFLAIGKALPVKADLKDESLTTRTKPPFAPFEHKSGLWGAERYIFTFGAAEDDNTLLMEVDYMGMFTPAPFLAQYNATGKIIGGTGAYANASGNVTAHGPFIVAPLPGGPPFSAWMAELKGTICGVQ